MSQPNKQSILVIGAFGMVGQALLHFGRELGLNISGSSQSKSEKYPEIHQLDLKSIKSIETVLNEITPDVVINAAGLNGFNICKQNPVLAHELNTQGVKNLVSTLSGSDIKIINLSSNVVFSVGEKPYTEVSNYSPKGVYGKTKMLGELEIHNYTGPYIIARTCDVYGPYYSTQKQDRFLHFVIKQLRKKAALQAFENIISNPTNIKDLCLAIFKLIEMEYNGTIHIAGDQAISRYQYALEIAKTFDLDETFVIPAYSDTYGSNSVLSIEKLKGLGIQMSSVKRGLNTIKNDFLRFHKLD